jgi:hypothetical protein
MRNKFNMLATVAAILLAGPVFAQDAVDPVAQQYAQTNGISISEASSRLNRLGEISAIEKRLTERFPEQFGGLYVVHSPTFKVVVKMTGSGQGLLRQITDDPLYVVEQAETPVKQLYQLKDRVARRLMNETKDFYFAVNVNIWDGTVEIRTTETDAVRQLLSADLQNNRKLRLVAATSGGPNTATVYGGRQLTGTVQSCTSGFTVRSDGGEGIITAGHCDDRMTIAGVTYNMVSRAYKNSDIWGFDVQLMRPSSAQTHPNQIYSDASVRETITKVFYAADIPLDWPICAFGTTTNVRRCGKLKAKWEVKRDNRGITGSFFRAAPDTSSAFTVEGDSGGPVFGTGTAYGIIKGRGDSVYPNHMYFMDIQTLEAYGGLDYNPRVKVAP